MRDLGAFLNALTDPCLASKQCLARWMPDEGTDVEGRFVAEVTRSNLSRAKREARQAELGGRFRRDDVS
jgi:hypothetical protein